MRDRLVAVVLLLSCAPAWGEEAPPAPAEVAPARSVLEEVDALYARRDQPGVLDRIDSMLEEARRSDPRSYAVAWRQARSAFWRAETTAGDDQRAKRARAAWDLAEKAVALDPAGGEAHYYAAISAGIYAETISVVKALMQGVEKPFLAHLRLALERVPRIDQGGPSLTMGRYHYSLPWPRYDGKESIRILRAVVRSFPANLRAKLYLAQTLHKEGEHAEAKKLLGEIAALDPGKDRPEEKLIKSRARAFLPEVVEDLE